MKAFIISSVVLLAMILSSLFISLKVASVSSEIASIAQKLPKDSRDAELKNMAGEIDRLWNQNYLLFQLTVRRDLVYSMDVCISNLNSVIGTDQNFDYISVREVLEVTANSIIGMEMPCIEGIL